MKKTVFVFWLVVFGFTAATGFAQSVTFPAGFEGTWKRPQYASTLTFTSNMVKASNRDVVWTLQSVSGNRYTMVSSGTNAALSLTVKLVDGNLEISGDSGAGESNWNGTYTNIADTVTFNAQGGSAVAAQTVHKRLHRALHRRACKGRGSTLTAGIGKQAVPTLETMALR